MYASMSTVSARPFATLDPRARTNRLGQPVRFRMAASNPDLLQDCDGHSGPRDT